MPVASGAVASGLRTGAQRCLKKRPKDVSGARSRPKMRKQLHAAMNKRKILNLDMKRLLSAEPLIGGKGKATNAGRTEEGAKKNPTAEGCTIARSTLQILETRIGGSGVRDCERIEQNKTKNNENFPRELRYHWSSAALAGRGTLLFGKVLLVAHIMESSIWAQEQSEIGSTRLSPEKRCLHTGTIY